MGEINYDKKNLKQLKKILKEQGKSTDGKKEALIKRCKEPYTSNNIMKILIDNVCKKLPKSIQTKLENVNKAQQNGPLSTKRVSQDSLIGIPYECVKQNKLTLKKLETHNTGVAVLLPFREYERIRDSEEKDELDEYLFNNIGSDNTVSCFITICGDDGYSGSTMLRKEYDRFCKEKDIKKSWKRVIRKEGVTNNVNKGNDKWEGHYFYDIKGGEQDTICSHEGEDRRYQIFTTHKNFMTNKDVIDDVKICLIYQMLKIHDIDKYVPQKDKYLKIVETYLKEQTYMGESCYDLIHKLDIFDDKGELLSAIEMEPISIDNFEYKRGRDDSIDISHNESVNKKIIYFDDTKNIMLSDYRPGNLFWDLHLGNMQQQDYTIKEYWEKAEIKAKKREQLQQLKAQSSNL